MMHFPQGTRTTIHPIQAHDMPTNFQGQFLLLKKAMKQEPIFLTTKNIYFSSLYEKV